MTNFIKVNNNKIQKIKNFTSQVIKDKKKETGYQFDNNNLYKRFYNGLLGEAAVEEYLGVEFIDWSIGPSRLYNKADLTDIGLNIGVKSVENNKFPLVKKKPVRGEIINIILNNNTVMICGYASVFDLLVFSSDKYVFSSSVI